MAVDRDRIRKMLENGRSIAEVVKAVGCSRTTVYAVDREGGGFSSSQRPKQQGSTDDPVLRRDRDATARAEALLQRRVVESRLKKLDEEARQARKATDAALWEQHEAAEKQLEATKLEAATRVREAAEQTARARLALQTEQLRGQHQREAVEQAEQREADRKVAESLEQLTSRLQAQAKDEEPASTEVEEPAKWYACAAGCGDFLADDSSAVCPECHGFLVLDD